MFEGGRRVIRLYRCPVAKVAGMSGPDHGSGPALVGAVAQVV
jgi:hypothetical protein